MNRKYSPTTKAGFVLAFMIALTPAALTHAQTTSAPATQTDPSGSDHVQGRGHHSPEKQLQWMTQKLSLTPDQVTQIKAIETDGMQQRDAIRADASIAAPDKHARMRALHETEQSKIKAVLTDQQKTQFDALLEKRKEHHERHGQAAPTTPPAGE